MQPRNDVVRLRLTTAEREAWSRAAGGKGRLSEWVRATCNTVALTDSGAVTTDSNSVTAAASVAAPETVTSGKCARWMHHRKGVYCGTCKQVN